MIELIATLRCTSCNLRDPCQAPASCLPWLRQSIGPLRQACRNTRRLFVVSAALVIALAVALGLLLVLH